MHIYYASTVGETEPFFTLKFNIDHNDGTKMPKEHVKL